MCGDTREREMRERGRCVCVCVFVCMYLALDFFSSDDHVRVCVVCILDLLFQSCVQWEPHVQPSKILWEGFKTL